MLSMSYGRGGGDDGGGSDKDEVWDSFIYACTLKVFSEKLLAKDSSNFQGI
jgi:hypothetical protein